jgi:hypothetical protein
MHGKTSADAWQPSGRQWGSRKGGEGAIRIINVRAVLAAMAVAALLSGCGVFCGGVGGNNGFAGGCGTSVRF